MQHTTFEIEQTRSLGGSCRVIGVDEVGRGPLAGPVVAAAVCYRDPLFAIPETLTEEFALMRDSKKLSAVQREKLFGIISTHFDIGIGIITADTIDRVNILEATFLAMKVAITELRRLAHRAPLITDTHNQWLFLIDGNQLIPSFSGKQEAIVGGDGIVKSIAVASIVAKVTRDRMMDDVDKLYPAYGFAKHKGYGTKQHMDALRKYGACPIHRQSFRPVALASPEVVNERFSRALQGKGR